MRYLNLLIIFCFNLAIAEPFYCSFDQFSKLEVSSPVQTNKIYRLHIYKLGAVNLVGMAVGSSNVQQMKNLASFYDQKLDQDKFCTWYLSDSNNTAINVFISHPIPDPFTISESEAPAVFMEAVQTSFFDDTLNFIYCAKKYYYIALGCDAQKHRGPTVFGMLLAFSGCTPEHSSEIVNTIWGLNGLTYNYRLDVINAAYDFGSKNNDKRIELLNIFTGNNNIK